MQIYIADYTIRNAHGL